MPVTERKVFQGDRVLAAKYLHAQRWDLIVFRNPQDPSNNYVKRLVGLPGEELAIKEGDVWINGVRIQKPVQIAQLVYEADPFADDEDAPDCAKVWGPVRLGQDEFFVLGDNSRASLDSRLWQQGAPGHPAYAVPAEYLIGVVTHTYWPPGRLRIFR